MVIDRSDTTATTPHLQTYLYHIYIMLLSLLFLPIFPNKTNIISYCFTGKEENRLNQELEINKENRLNQEMETSELITFTYPQQ